MSLKTYNVLSIFCIIFIVGIYSCGSPGNEKRFSLKRLFNSSSDKEEIFIDQHIDWSSVSEYQEEVKRLYADRNFMPVWINDESLNDLGVQLTSILKSSWEEGLPEPVVYLERVEEYLLRLSNEETKKDQKAQLIAVADVSLTQAYFDYASNLSSGIINPKELNVIWEILPGEIDLVKHLEHGIKRGNLSNSLQQLKPKHEQYVLLLEAFKNLMQIKKEGGWPVPGPLPVMKKNDTHNGLVGLKKYLTVTGDLNEQDSTWLHSIKFDNNLSEAIKRFQFRHGLEQDGTIGQLTLKMMNVSIDDRIDQIRLNLDRIRWYPEDFGRTHIKINIPAFSFEYFKNGKVQQEMKVVVGQNENYTPVLEDTLYAVVFNPVWNVPNSISTHEIFPKMLEDNTYLKRNHYSILKDSYVSTDTIDYQTYDWQEVSRDSFPFFIVQHPGPLNSLGRVQFLLENQYSIFLHDTPANHLFNIEQRDFSHGCVRLERPAELAVTLLKDQLPKDTIIKYLSEKEKKIIRLEEKIPVHLTYQTAWMDDDDRLHFREDIYGFDELSMPVLRNTSAEIALKKD